MIAAGLALAFAFTNGALDAANSIATMVATRAARPQQAIVLASVFNLLGPLLIGGAVATTIGGIVQVPPADVTEVIGAGLAGAVVWNVSVLRLGVPSSSSHALIGGLVGASLAEGGTAAVNWGGLDGIRPVGVVGILIALALTPLLAAGVGLIVIRTVRRLWRRATRHWLGPVRSGQWTMSGALAFSHGANDAQKTIGVLAALLVANGQIHSPSAPVSVKLACAAALTIGTALGGWRIIRTVGRRIYPIRPVESLASQTASASVIFGAALAGAPTSTSQVVSSSIVGIGGGRRRWRHVHWEIVRRIGLAWVITLPASALLGVAALGLWQAL